MIEKFKAHLVGFNYLPGDESSRLIRNINFLLATAAGTCPGDREFGLNQDFESQSPEVVENLLTLEITEKLERYVPSVEMSDISFNHSTDGNTQCRITISPTDMENEEE